MKNLLGILAMGSLLAGSVAFADADPIRIQCKSKETSFQEVAVAANQAIEVATKFKPSTGYYWKSKQGLHSAMKNISPSGAHAAPGSDLVQQTFTITPSDIARRKNWFGNARFKLYYYAPAPYGEAKAVCIIKVTPKK